MSQIPWWQSAVIYQIYPKSFQDSAARGTGDLKGIMARLDYLKTLGVDALWLTPVYVSPQVDNGYDIADYYAIDPAYGTMDDFEALLAAAHVRDIRIVMDIVVNHTSTEHAWFKSALGDKNSPYRDYYIWRDPVNGGVPNNWQSKFGGSAWELEQATGQYYLHLFAREQADLNWENPAVRAEVKNIIHFWAKKGVDGFRLDVINLISKDQAFPNDEIGDGRRFYTDGPRIHEFLQDVSRDVFAPVGAMTVGEMSSTSLEHCQRYGALDGSELSMVFNFHHLKVDYPNGDKWTKAPFDFLELKRIFNHWQSGMHGKGWSALFWCNHDQPRIVSRFGDEGEHRVVAAKMLASTLHGLQGTPYIYQGEEIGMTNPGYQHIDDYQDVESRNIFAIKQAEGMSEAEILAILGAKSRDNSRTPMQWSAAANAGFTSGMPWLKPAANYPEINAEAALADQNSVFWHYRDLIALRKAHPIFTQGDYQELLTGHPQIWAYARRANGQTLLVVSNFYGEPVEFALPAELQSGQGRLLLGNYPDSPAQPQSGMLRPYESLIWLME
ncbi:MULTISPECIES: alpha,alpha-phosphotrehalase [Aeromonas]|jgi:trehalose-6-phosphate hydrolase|uniref:Alpha,alpha-phosphotrehalase n=2 Tax=Gammaproteobacteria TaxID=1236 RepID=A0A2T4MXP6_AERVE|nr:alpha,alpha-phosphotrehalase [Aeromonas veronii]AXV21728.1 alpha,alpha-phosphotrehalase [Aeromonas veronii]MBA2797345.1 alpha,alpha-phosphotrehalase [Aeromonas veronii]MCX0445329.1 alpha,alpha-phosphotrehalase [Aeromonas veronii]PTH79341.1 alpha,alpha-phosphotrehalase [Aeromonas veronii]RDE63014.1 alpha,alpha-phosphotrehalase [Aeromonas veronii]